MAICICKVATFYRHLNILYKNNVLQYVLINSNLYYVVISSFLFVSTLCIFSASSSLITQDAHKADRVKVSVGYLFFSSSY